MPGHLRVVVLALVSCLFTRAVGAQTQAGSVDEGLWAESIDGERWAMGRDVLLALAGEAIAGGFVVAPAADGVVVRQMPAAAWARALDIRVGDRIALVNGVVPRDRATVRAALSAVLRLRELSLSLVRGGQKLDRRYLYDRPIRPPRPPTADVADIVSALAGVTRIDHSGRRTIERGALELVGRHPGAFRDRGSDGSVDPLRKLLGLTRFDSLLGVADTRLGIANDQAAALLAQQAGAREFEVVVDRMGQTVTVTYQVVRAPARRQLKRALEDFSRLAGAPDKVVKRSDTEFEVERRLAIQMRGNPEAMIGSTRVVPSVKNGKPNGFKLYAIRPTSLLAALGLRNGDTIVAVAGHELGGFETLAGAGVAADKALGRTKGLVTISIDIVRRGQPLRLRYMVKPAKAK